MVPLRTAVFAGFLPAKPFASVSGAPPVPTTNSTMPFGDHRAAGVQGVEPLVAVVVPGEDQVGAVVHQRLPDRASSSVVLPWQPELKRGWCQ